MPKSVHEKIGLRAEDKVMLLHAPEDAVKSIEFPGLKLHTYLKGEFDHIILFVVSQENMQTKFSEVKSHVNKKGKLWVAWPKAKKLSSDLTIRSVIRIGYDACMVESTNLSINDTWTALKFTWPKPGKIYTNSYGTLPKS